MFFRSKTLKCSRIRHVLKRMYEMGVLKTIFEIVIDFFPLYNMHVTEEKQGN